MFHGAYIFRRPGTPLKAQLPKPTKIPLYCRQILLGKGTSRFLTDFLRVKGLTSEHFLKS